MLQVCIHDLNKKQLGLHFSYAGVEEFELKPKALINDIARVELRLGSGISIIQTHSLQLCTNFARILQCSKTLKGFQDCFVALKYIRKVRSWALNIGDEGNIICIFIKLLIKDLL